MKKFILITSLILSACSNDDYKIEKYDGDTDHSESMATEAEMRKNGCHFTASPVTLVCEKHQTFLQAYQQNLSVFEYVQQARTFFRKTQPPIPVGTTLNWVTLSTLNLKIKEAENKSYPKRTLNPDANVPAQYLGSIALSSHPAQQAEAQTYEFLIQILWRTHGIMKIDGDTAKFDGSKCSPSGQELIASALAERRSMLSTPGLPALVQNIYVELEKSVGAK